MTQPESKVIKDIRQWIEKREGVAIKYHGSSRSTRGIPDLICVLPTHGVFMIETKVKGNKPTSIQTAWIERINQSGGRAFWANSLQSFIEQL